MTTDTLTPIPEGYEHPTPYLQAADAEALIGFMTAVFGAEERMRLTMPGGSTIMHAEVAINGRSLMLSDPMPGCEALTPHKLGGTPVGMHVYVADVDATLARAEAAGATVTMAAEDKFWGDRMARFTDPQGFSWMIASRQREVTPEEVAAGAAAMAAGG